MKSMIIRLLRLQLQSKMSKDNQLLEKYMRKFKGTEFELSEDLIAFTLELSEDLNKNISNMKYPDACPGPDGTLELYWQKGDLSVSIDIMPDNNFEVFFYDHVKKISENTDYKWDDFDLKNICKYINILYERKEQK